MRPICLVGADRPKTNEDCLAYDALCREELVRADFGHYRRQLGVNLRHLALFGRTRSPQIAAATENTAAAGSRHN